MKYEQILNKGGNISIAGISFEEPDIEMLIVNEDNYEEQLSKQAAGLAYFGTMTRLAKGDLEQAKHSWEARWSEMVSQCARLSQKDAKRTTKNDHEVLARSKYTDEINTWVNKIKDKQEELDVAEMFYESWKQKSFVLNNMTNLVTAGLLSPKQTVQDSEYPEQEYNKEGKDRIRNALKVARDEKKRREDL